MINVKYDESIISQEEMQKRCKKKINELINNINELNSKSKFSKNDYVLLSDLLKCYK